VVGLKPSWSKSTPVNGGTPAYRDLGAKSGFNVWDPDHFAAEWAELVDELAAIRARHVIIATVPHVTIAQVARGVDLEAAVAEVAHHEDPHGRGPLLVGAPELPPVGHGAPPAAPSARSSRRASRA